MAAPRLQQFAQRLTHGGTRVRIAGAGDHMQPADAEHADDEVRFRAMLKLKPGESLVAITGPRLTTAQAARWVKMRLQRFTDHPGARESREDAVRRKVIAAQGTPFTQRLRDTLDTHGQMELDMMLSKDSHAQGTNKPGPAAYTLTVTADGTVSGLPTAVTLGDTEGRTLRASE